MSKEIPDKRTIEDKYKDHFRLVDQSDSSNKSVKTEPSDPYHDNYSVGNDNIGDHAGEDLY